MRVCDVDGCDRRHYGLGFCSGHYCRHVKGQSPWVSSQPPGQRVEDVVEWARSILRRYDI